MVPDGIPVTATRPVHSQPSVIIIAALAATNPLIALFLGQAHGEAIILVKDVAYLVINVLLIAPTSGANPIIMTLVNQNVSTQAAFITQGTAHASVVHAAYAAGLLALDVIPEKPV